MNSASYDNSGFNPNDGNNHIGKTSTLEMERVIVVEADVAKCCGRYSNAIDNQNVSDCHYNCPKTPVADVTPNVCLPKCPAVKASPWDPVKTRFAAVLTMAMVVWLLFGIFVIKY